MIIKKIISRVLIGCGLLVLLAGCSHTFEGNCIKGNDFYKLDAESMSDTSSHTLELEKGDKLQIHFESKSGSLTMEIIAPDGTLIYQGNGTGTTDFILNVPEDGDYDISVEGKKAKGSIYIEVNTSTDATDKNRDA